METPRAKSYTPKCAATQRPPAAATIAGSGHRPSAATSACGVSTITSSRSAPAASPSFGSKSANTSTSAATCSGTTTLGRVTTKFGGSAPRVPSTSASRNSSSVRTARACRSRLKGLIRIPQNGGSAPWAIPCATSRAAARAVASSSASGRLP